MKLYCDFGLDLNYNTFISLKLKYIKIRNPLFAQPYLVKQQQNANVT